MDKVRVIERSVRCFIAGCLSLIPVLGLLPAVFALVLVHQVRRETGPSWNPARGYLICGNVLAWVGIAIPLIAAGFRLSRALN